jgi:hypothetical protein
LIYSIFEQLEKVRDLQFDEVLHSSSPFEIRLLTLLKLSEACHISVQLDGNDLQSGKIVFNAVQTRGEIMLDEAEENNKIIDWASNGIAAERVDIIGAPANGEISRPTKSYK